MRYIKGIIITSLFLIITFNTVVVELLAGQIILKEELFSS